LNAGNIVQLQTVNHISERLLIGIHNRRHIVFMFQADGMADFMQSQTDILSRLSSCGRKKARILGKKISWQKAS
jgi:hypothetical protein